ncbi:MAG TPA: prolipoprotein diacylglyceryl transferase [Gaiellaceae bacterium]|jgi:prolipoprotein diacylglyceryl transferase|nr:prolipoprotein diacylglyceryl transferase [Gaiellaceae bacterium]
MILSIPSPSRGEIDLGPLSIHAYGLMLLLAIVAATVLTGIRWTRRGGDWDLVFQVAVWGVAFGIIGARLYHVVTSWNEVPDEWWGVFAVWKGGLGVWGGIFLGVIAGAVVVKRSGESVLAFMDAVAPGLLLAQAIGRWGNWFNQELYGKPTNLPWGLEIDLDHRPSDINLLQQDTFHPVFLYEFAWNLIGVVVLLLLDKFVRFRPPALFALYVAWYTAFRAFEETLRIDPSHEWFGFRLNFYVSVVLFALSMGFFIWWQFIRRHGEPSPAGRRPLPPRGPQMAVPRSRVRG